MVFDLGDVFATSRRFEAEGVLGTVGALATASGSPSMALDVSIFDVVQGVGARGAGECAPVVGVPLGGPGAMVDVRRW